MKITAFHIVNIFVMLFIFSACQEANKRVWYCKEANIKLEICVNDTCDIFIINNTDSIFTKHNGTYYEFYSLHFITGSDSLYFIDHGYRVFKVKHNYYNIITYDVDTVNFIYEPEKILDRRGLTIQGHENGIFFLYIDGEYKGEVPYISD